MGTNDADVDLDALGVSLSKAIGGREEVADDLAGKFVAELGARDVVLPATSIADLDERVKAAVYGAVETCGELQRTVVPRFVPRSMLNLPTRCSLLLSTSSPVNSSVPIPMSDPRRALRKASPAELDRLSEYSESDKQRAREAARIDGSPRVRAMLDAEPVKPKGKKRPR